MGIKAMVDTLKTDFKVLQVTAGQKNEVDHPEHKNAEKIAVNPKDAFLPLRQRAEQARGFDTQPSVWVAGALHAAVKQKYEKVAGDDAGTEGAQKSYKDCYEAKVDNKDGL